MDVEKTLQVLAEVKDETTETLHHFEGKLLSAKLAAGPQRHIDNYTAGRDNAQERILFVSNTIAIIKAAKVVESSAFGVQGEEWVMVKREPWLRLVSLLSSTPPSDGNS